MPNSVPKVWKEDKDKPKIRKEIHKEVLLGFVKKQEKK